MVRAGQVVLIGVALAVGPACKGDTAGQAAAPPATPRAPGPPEIDGRAALPDPLPEVAARVNGQAIPTARVKMMAEEALRSGSFPPDQKALAYRKVLDQYIVRELLVQEALARGIKADPKVLQEAENAQRARFPNAEAFRAALASQGADEAMFQAELRAQVTVDALVAELRKETPPEAVSDAELQKFYEENPAQFTSTDRVKAAHILLRTPKDLPAERKAELRAKAEQILKEIRGGGDFAALAAKHSQDNSTKDRGGEMDAFGHRQMPAELAALEKAIRSQEPGKVSDVVETPAGFHIVKTLARLADETMPLEPVKEQVRHYLLNQKRQQALQAFVNGLRAKAKIETHL